MANAVFDDANNVLGGSANLDNTSWIKKMDDALDSLDKPLTVGEVQQFLLQHASILSNKVRNIPLTAREIHQYLKENAGVLGEKARETITDHLNRLGEA